MRVFVWIFCTSDLVWVDPVFVDCQRSCICGLSGILYLWIVTDPVFVDRHLDLLTIKICWRGWVVPLPPLVSDPSDCRDVCPFVTPAPKFPSRQARRPKMSTMWTKSAQNRLGHAAVAQCFDWLPDILALFMGKGEGLSIWLASRSSLKKTELTKLLWIGHQTSRERRGVRSIWGSSMFDKHRGAQFIGHLSVLCRQADCICYVPNIPLKLWIVWDRDIHLYSQE